MPLKDKRRANWMRRSVPETVLGCDRSCRCRRGAGVGQVGVRNVEDRSVRWVEGFGAELELEAFGGAVSLNKGSPRSWWGGRQRPADQVAPGEGGSDLIGGDVEVLIRGAAAGRRLIGYVAISHVGMQRDQTP